jgi:Ca-activated chloride channel family protein
MQKSAASRCFLVAALFLWASTLRPQEIQPQYKIPVTVDEVRLDFSATDFSNHPINNLAVSDVHLLDNNKPPKKVLRFTHQVDLPLRIGVLVDTSRSMLGGALIRNQKIASTLSEHILRSTTDRAFIAEFDFSLQLLQSWSGTTDDLNQAIHKVGWDAKSRYGGTAIYDSIYRAVRDQFVRRPTLTTETANAVLLFSDGEDTWSHAEIKDVVEICQQAHTAIYVFSDQPDTRFDAGEKNLRELAASTGGQVFYAVDQDTALTDLKTIENALRNHYSLVYAPANIRDDGKFHSIKLTIPKSGLITVRSGYYAPTKSGQ